MPQISRNPLLIEVYDHIYKVFTRALSKNKSRKEIDSFLNELLTPTEKLMLSKRLMIFYLLDQGLSYRRIEELLHVSTSTVNRLETRYRNSKQVKKIVNELNKEKQFDDLLTELGIGITGVLDFSGSKTKTWKKLNNSISHRKKSNL